MKLKKDLFEKHVKSFEPGTTIFEEGDRGEELYVIIEGEVEIRKTTFRSSSKTLITLQAGDIFGEMAIIEKKARSATAVITKATRLLVMNVDLFESMIETNTDFAKKIIKILSERLRRANAILQNIMISNKENMVVNGLQEYIKEYAVAVFNGYKINENEFMDWVCQHIGISEKEIQIILENLKKKKVLIESTTNKEELIIKKTPK